MPFPLENKMHPTRLLPLCVALFAFAACAPSPDPLDVPPTEQEESPIKGPPVRLGINAAPPPGVPFGGWPDPGSPNALYMVRLWDLDVTWAQIEPSPPVNGTPR